MLEAVALFLLGFAAFAFSTVAGGGGALLLVSTIPYFIGVERVVQTVHLANFLGRPSRILLFFKSIDWPLVLVFVPAAWLGAWMGVRLFVAIEAEWLGLFLGLFLLSTPFQFRFGKKRVSFPMKLWYFAPLALVIAVISSMTGATGAVLNVFYFNRGLNKEALIGTKAMNSFLVAIVQLWAYDHYGALSPEIWMYGLIIGAGAILGNIAGKRLLQKITDQRFQQIAIGLMVLSGLMLLLRWAQPYLA